MNEKENIPNGLWKEIFQALPEEKPADGLNLRIMDLVRRESQAAERKSERRILVGLIALAVVVLAVGVWALYYYIDWKMVRLPEISGKDIVGMFPETGNSLARIPAYLPLAGIILFLLLMDGVLRRRFWVRHRQ